MHLFKKIEGQRGENLATSLLSYILFSSVEIKDDFIKFLSDNSPKGPFFSDMQFYCMTESQADSERHGQCRIDMLIDVDTMVMAIESKFYAEFQEGQPHKYIERLRKIAKGGEIYKTDKEYLAYVLCPRSRGQEVRGHIQEKLEDQHNARDFSVIYWDDLCDVIKTSADKLSNDGVKFLVNEFVTYVNDICGFMPNYMSIYRHTKNDFEPRGTPLHVNFVQNLWRFLPEAGPRLSAGDTYVGYYFYTKTTNQEGWFGFVSKEKIKAKTKNNVELIIASTYKPETSGDEGVPDALIEVELLSDNWLNTDKKTYFWAIDYDEKWCNSDIWFENLRFLSEAARNDKE